MWTGNSVTFANASDLETRSVMTPKTSVPRSQVHARLLWSADGPIAALDGAASVGCWFDISV